MSSSHRRVAGVELSCENGIGHGDGGYGFNLH